MSSAPAAHPTPAAAPSGAPAAAAVITEIPEIMAVRKGFFRWIGLTLRGTKDKVAGAFKNVFWNFPKYLAVTPYKYFRGDPTLTWAGTNLWTGLVKHPTNPESYRIFPDAHGHAAHDEHHPA